MSIERAKPSEKLVKESIAHFGNLLSREFQAKLEATKRRAELSETALGPLRSLLERDSKSAEAIGHLGKLAKDEYRQHRAAADKLTKRRPGLQFLLTVNPGLNLLGPPYDAQWTSDPIQQADQNAGTFQSVAIDSLTFGAAGLGVFLTSSQTVNARFSADMLYSFSWVDWPIPAGSYTASDGGVGVLIYAGGNVVVDQRASLWNDVETVTPQSGSGDGYLVYTSAGQIYFVMEAGVTYLAWVWCWTDAAITNNSSLSSASLQCNMPFIVVED